MFLTWPRPDSVHELASDEQTLRRVPFQVQTLYGFIILQSEVSQWWFTRALFRYAAVESNYDWPNHFASSGPHYTMIKYFGLSPLWKYLLRKGGSLLPMHHENAILINSNLVKGYLASNLYKPDYKLLYFTNLAHKASLDEYDINRITATFLPIKLELTGLERYEHALPKLYVQSIYSKGKEYYEYLFDLCRSSVLDIIDLFILINDESKPQCFKFLIRYIKHMSIPEFFMQHIEKLLIEKAPEISLQTIEEFIKVFQQRQLDVSNLQAIARVKSLKEGGRVNTTRKAQKQEHIRKILNTIGQLQYSVIYNAVFDPENITALARHLSQIGQGMAIDQSISLNLKVDILKLVQSYFQLFPRRNVLRDKVPQEERSLKIRELEYEKQLKQLIITKISKALPQSKGEELVQLLDVVDRYSLYNPSMKANSYRQSLIEKVRGNPLLYLNHPAMLTKAIEASISANINPRQMASLLNNFVDKIQSPSHLLTLLHSSKKHRKQTKLIQDQLQRLSERDSIKISLKQYLQSSEFFDTLKNIDIQMGSLIELIGYLKGNSLKQPLKSLQKEDTNNLLSLNNILKGLKYEAKLNGDKLEVVKDGSTLVVTKTKLFEPLFRQFDKQRIHKQNKVHRQNKIRLEAQREAEQERLRQQKWKREREARKKLKQEQQDSSVQQFRL